MKKLRRLLSVMASAALVLALAGCNQQTGGSGSGGGQGSGSGSGSGQQSTWKPSGQVDMIIGSSAGSSQDTAARVFAQCVENVAGVRINIINNTGGGGTVANVEVMNAKGDGMTLGQFGSTMATDQYTVDGCNYSQDTYKILGVHSEESAHLCVNAKGPYADMTAEEFLTYAKDHPGEVKMAISGTWNLYDTTRHLLEQEYGASFQRVGIKGGTNCLLSLMAGDVDATLAFPVEVQPLAESGDVKVLAQLGEERNNFFPDVPTFKELGFDCALTASKAVVLPPDTSDEIYAGWETIFEQVMADPATETAFTEAGLTFSPYIGTDAYDHINEYGDFIKTNFVDTGVYDQPLG